MISKHLQMGFLLELRPAKETQLTQLSLSGGEAQIQSNSMSMFMDLSQ